MGVEVEWIRRPSTAWWFTALIFGIAFLNLAVLVGVPPDLVSTWQGALVLTGFATLVGLALGAWSWSKERRDRAAFKR